MIKKILIVLSILLIQATYAQKAQKVGYIDREFILENIPEYATAQANLDSRVQKWNTKLDGFKNEIETMKLDLANEKALLTSDLVAEREEDILIKQTALKKLQEDYFGTSGDLFTLRKQLVKPVQDQVFNAIQEIAKTKKYDIVFDKSSDDIVMLYNNPKYDISELVLQKIVKGRKKKAIAKERSEKEIARDVKKAELKNKAEERKTKQEQLKEKIRIRNEEKAAKREALKKANLEKREKRRAEIKAKREARKNKVKAAKTAKEEIEKEEETSKIESKAETVNEGTEDKKEETVKTKEELRAEKLKALEEQNKAKKAKRDSLQKIAAEKRAKKMAEIEARKNKSKEN